MAADKDRISYTVQESTTSLASLFEKSRIWLARSDSFETTESSIINPVARISPTPDPALPCSHNHTDTTSKNSSFSSLPHETLVQILSYLELGTATCAGLTCTRAYYALKILYPHTKIPLSEACWDESGIFNGHLCDKVENWILSSGKYRRKRWTNVSSLADPSWAPPQYLNKAVYGDRSGSFGDAIWKKEEELLERYVDYDWFEVVSEQKLIHVLPNPFGKGERWYDEAKVCIVKAAETQVDWCSWVRYWDNAFVFQRISYMEKLKVLQHFEKRKSPKALMRMSKRKWLTSRTKRYVRFLAWWTAGLPESKPFPEIEYRTPTKLGGQFRDLNGV